ncbi:MAG: single stranded DNA-binding domain-containing protein [Candidatus Geothermincolia bacterium]
MKENITGIVQNISSNPFQTFTRHKSRNSAVLSFDISFDLVDEDGKSRHVWFKRSFRLPPKFADGDHVDVVGRQGYLWGLLGRRNFYALRIIDKKRKTEYTPWRNIVVGEGRKKEGKADKSRASSGETVA